MGRTITAWAALVAAALLLGVAGCTSSGSAGPSTSPPASSSPAPDSTTATSASTSSTAPPSSSSSATADSQGQAAIAAYLAFTRASDAAERKPADLSRVKAIKAHSVDPALGKEGASLFDFRQSHIEWRGTPPTSRVKVTSASTTGAHPTVTLRDCPTVSKTWRPYDSRTGKPLKLVKPKVAPPWAATVTVINYKGRWVVQTTKVDMSRTCTP